MVVTSVSPVKLPVTNRVGQVIKLNGIGFRSFFWKHNLVLQVGYSHYLLRRIPVTSLVRTSKSLIALSSPTIYSSVVQLRLPDAYKGRGLLLTTVPLKLKPGKRR